MKKEVWMVVVLVLVATVSAGVLGFVNVTTRPIIEANEARKLRESVLNSVKVDYTSENLEDKFTSEMETKEIDGREVFFRYDESGDLSAVAFRMSGSGFQGPIQGIISLKPDLETIVGVEILSQQETPGLGARITEDWFLDQFNEKKVRPELRIVKGGSEGPNEVDAITGATRTSKSVQGIINNEVKKMKNDVLTDEVMEGSGDE
ncbi:RnfABCDGE type electron transport complex subunit G [Candidatus Bipolaricaulota bacterium]|nr:RnfABCDGE type electron transport complex subunit G [Candidatus Bipolaricaulota bacterium]